MKQQQTTQLDTKANVNVLYIVNDLSETHGWGTYASTLVTESIACGYEVHAAVVHTTKSEHVSLRQYPVLFPPLLLLSNPLRNFLQYLKLRSLVRKIQPDIVHVIVEPYVMPFAFMVGMRVPLVLTLHGTYSMLPAVVSGTVRRWLSRFLFTQALQRVHTAIAVSEQTRKRFVRGAFGFPEEHVTVVPNAVASLNQPVPYHETETSADFSIITIGAVKRRKGIHETIHMFSSWANTRRRKVTYHVVGSLTETPEYAALVAGLAKEHEGDYFSVVLHGKVEARLKHKLLEEASLYVHLERVMPTSTEVEGFGISIIEAAAYGIPALVARGSATEEAVKENVSGYVLDLQSGDDTIHETIDRILLHRSIQKSDVVGWAMEHRAQEIFKKIEGVYRPLLGRV